MRIGGREQVVEKRLGMLPVTEAGQRLLDLDAAAVVQEDHVPSLARPDPAEPIFAAPARSRPAANVRWRMLAATGALDDGEA